MASHCSQEKTPSSFRGMYDLVLVNPPKFISYPSRADCTKDLTRSGHTCGVVSQLDAFGSTFPLPGMLSLALTTWETFPQSFKTQLR